MKPQAVEPVYFAFENDFVDSLRCIPMVVRYKLDTCGIKLKLPEWVRLKVEEKRMLAEMPCLIPDEITQYRAYLIQLVQDRCGRTASELPPVDAVWDNLGAVPAEVQQRADEYHCPRLTVQDWMQLSVLQRFALVKLSWSGHEGANFPRAMAEFGLKTDNAQ